MATFTLPNTPLGKFVGANYKGASLQKSVLKKLSKKGVTSPVNRLPNTLLGVPGVRGPYSSAPNLNPDQWLTTPNKWGKFFAQPVTDLTGIADPADRKLVTSFDETTAKRVPGIQAAYGDLTTSLNQNADATKNRLASLGTSIQASPLVAGPTAQQAVPDANAQLAQTQRQQQAAQSAVQVGLQSALPAVAGIEGTKAVQDFQTQRAGARTELLTGIRQAQAEAQAAAAERSAQMRGQDLQLLGTQLAQAGGTDRALISAATSQGNNRASLENQLLIAELNGDVSTANNIRTTLASMNNAATRASTTGTKATVQQNAKAKDQAKYIANVRKNLTGSFVKNPAFVDAITTPDVDPYIAKPGSTGTPESLLADAIAQGFKPLPVLNAIRAVLPGSGRTQSSAITIRDILIDGGYSKAQAEKIAKRFTGVKKITGLSARPIG